MNAPPNEIITPDGTPFNWAAYHGYEPQPGRKTRYDGWTPEKQQTFLTALSEGHSVVSACNIVRMSKQSAYAFRHSARGAGFALGWDAALLRGRDVLADELMDRALHGVKEWTQTDDRLVTRFRHDNRLAMAMLTRLDRRCDASQSSGQSPAGRSDAAQAAARLIAQDFEQYLELLGRDGGPARAGLFLGARAEAASEDDLAPIRALARADRWLRTHTDLADPLDTGDLDPARRAEWTGAQWARAEAAGLVQLAPATLPATDQGRARDGNGQDGQHNASGGEDAPVWWDDIRDEWRTRFPPPHDFIGNEEGAFGEQDYNRALDVDEEMIVERPYRIEVDRRLAREARERDAWFAAQRDLVAVGAGETDTDRRDEAPPMPGDVAGKAPPPPADADEDDDWDEDWDDEDWDEEDGEDAAPADPEAPSPPAAGAAEDAPAASLPGAGEAPGLAEAPDGASAQPRRSRPYTSSRKATPPPVAAAVM